MPLTHHRHHRSYCQNLENKSKSLSFSLSCSPSSLPNLGPQQVNNPKPDLIVHHGWFKPPSSFDFQVWIDNPGERERESKVSLDLVSSSWIPLNLVTSSWERDTTKKSSYCSVFLPALLKIAIIKKPVPALFETASIGNSIMASQNWRFNNRCNRRPIAAVPKTLV